MLSHLPRKFLELLALGACALPLTAAAQSIAYGDVSGGVDAPQSGSGGEQPASSGRASHEGHGKPARFVHVTPYIQAEQVATAELSPGNDVVTYSVLAAGVDAEAVGLRNAASVSLRYERRFGWGKNANDSDFLSGIARGYATVVPGLKIEAGGLATRTSIESDGVAIPGTLPNGDTLSKIYSVYGGPSLATHAGDVAVNANYRIGYTKLKQSNNYVPPSGQPAADIFDHSTIQAADVHAGVKPYEVLPVGVGAGAGYYREDISNLDQRIKDFHARGDVTVPVSPSVELVGGLGYEDVQISSRDVLRDANGQPVIGSDGRYVTDKSSPRIIAYDTSGLIWDAGVLWRPSPRTSLEAHVGRRYGSTSVYGSFAYSPDSRSSINISVYDNIAGFGGQVNRALVDLPSEFTAVRNPLSGDIGGCVSSLDKGSCLTGALGSVRSATFRARGVMASYGLKFNRISAGIGFGYDRRKFIAAPGTILASANGIVDENYWLSAYLDGRIDRRSSFSTNLYANWFQPGSGAGGDQKAIGASAAYHRYLSDRLSATAALGIDGVNRQAPLDDNWIASALLGMRYNF